MSLKMKNSLFKDAYGDYSSKRVFGAIIIVYYMILSGLDGLDWFSINETVVIAAMGIGATLLGLDSVVEIWKQPKESTNEENSKTEPE